MAAADPWAALGAPPPPSGGGGGDDPFAFVGGPPRQPQPPPPPQQQQQQQQQQPMGPPMGQQPPRQPMMGQQPQQQPPMGQMGRPMMGQQPPQQPMMGQPPQQQPMGQPMAMVPAPQMQAASQFAMGGGGGGNPFDPFAASPALGPAAAGGAGSDPFAAFGGGPNPAPQQPQPPQQMQPQLMVPGGASIFNGVAGAAALPYGTYGMSPQQGQGGGQMVPAAQQPNPYAMGGPPQQQQGMQQMQQQMQGMTLGQPPLQPGQQQLVPQQQQQMAPQQPQPFGGASAPTPAATTAAVDDDDFFGVFSSKQPDKEAEEAKKAAAEAEAAAKAARSIAASTAASTSSAPARPPTSRSDEVSVGSGGRRRSSGTPAPRPSPRGSPRASVSERKGPHPYDDGAHNDIQAVGSGGSTAGGSKSDSFSPPEETKDLSNQYGREIATKVSLPDSSPLPDPDQVGRNGYVQSRISFRTILLKKWKQAFWVQYGPNSILFFRTRADFGDWLNNPYLTGEQREFLVKLNVDFVGDLQKVNVRGYQVTQVRAKGYKAKMLHQFKLERWMDYGPTIAAAFASTDLKEVRDLRRAMVDIMKNCPQDPVMVQGMGGMGGVGGGGPGGEQYQHPSGDLQGGDRSGSYESGGDPHSQHQQSRSQSHSGSSNPTYAYGGSHSDRRTQSMPDMPPGGGGGGGGGGNGHGGGYVGGGASTGAIDENDELSLLSGVLSDGGGPGGGGGTAGLAARYQEHRAESMGAVENDFIRKGGGEGGPAKQPYPYHQSNGYDSAVDERRQMYQVTR